MPSPRFPALPTGSHSLPRRSSSSARASMRELAPRPIRARPYRLPCPLSLLPRSLRNARMHLFSRLRGQPIGSVLTEMSRRFTVAPLKMSGPGKSVGFGCCNVDSSRHDGGHLACIAARAWVTHQSANTVKRAGTRSRFGPTPRAPFLPPADYDDVVKSRDIQRSSL